MAQPPGYDRQIDFEAYQVSNPTDPIKGTDLDTEFNKIKASIDALINNINYLQRDDLEVENRTIGTEQLKSDVLTEFGQAIAARPQTYIFDISTTTDTISGTDRNGNTMEYTVGFGNYKMYIDGVLVDDADITATDGTSAVYTTNFPNPSVVTFEALIVESGLGNTVSKLDDISSTFNGILTAFTMEVDSVPLTINKDANLTVLLDDVRLEPTVDYQVSGTTLTFTTAPTAGQSFWAIADQLFSLGAGSVGSTELEMIV